MFAGNNGNPTEVNYNVDTQLVTFDIMSLLAFGRIPDTISKSSSPISRGTEGDHVTPRITNCPRVAIVPTIHSYHASMEDKVLRFGRAQ